MPLSLSLSLSLCFDNVMNALPSSLSFFVSMFETLSVFYFSMTSRLFSLPRFMIHIAADAMIFLCGYTDFSALYSRSSLHGVLVSENGDAATSVISLRPFRYEAVMLGVSGVSGTPEQSKRRSTNKKYVFRYHVYTWCGGCFCSVVSSSRPSRAPPFAEALFHHFTCM